ncbi:MAG: DMT family transporter, partial [Kiritimatiellae bacterium]|nr:DMT family transporter [Kiritimatiellia bacterium]
MTDRFKGILSITASALGFAAMAMLVRLADDYGEPVSSFQKSFFLNIIALIIAIFVFLKYKNKKQPSKHFSPPSRKVYFLMLLRSLSGCIGIFANFYALSKIPIAEAMALNKTAPFFTVALSWIFLKEKARLIQFASLATAFTGVLMVIKPG